MQRLHGWTKTLVLIPSEEVLPQTRDAKIKEIADVQNDQNQAAMTEVKKDMCDKYSAAYDAMTEYHENLRTIV